MIREMLRAKIHRMTATEADLEYEGSITIDADLMAAVDMRPYERVEVYNLTNGHRLTTYAIGGEAGSGVCCANGAAAHLVERGDELIVCSYCGVAEQELDNHAPRIVVLDRENRVKQTSTVPAS